MAPEITETIPNGQVASFQGDNISFGHVKNFSAGSPELMHLNNGKQALIDSESDGTLSYDQLVWLQNYYWPAFYPDVLQEMNPQPHPRDGWVYPSSQGPYVGPHWLSQYPLQVVPQSYPPEYNFQEFQYFVVIDFEATCDKLKIPQPQEIIEFPSVLVNGLTGQLEDCFQMYVRPTYNQLLTEFCKDLTGIQQSQVDKGVLLNDALRLHDKWLKGKGVKDTNFAIVTWSNWDCRVILESECRYKRIEKPEYFNRWINLKIPFGEAFGGLRCNLKEAVDRAGLTWEGRPHCGLDDAKNTARLLVHLMACGLKLSITNNLMWQTADHPTPPESGTSYLATPYKSKGLSYKNAIAQQANAAKESHIYCYCGAVSVKRDCKDTAPQKDGFFIGCGNCTAKGRGCNFLKWVSFSEPAKAG